MLITIAVDSSLYYINVSMLCMQGCAYYCIILNHVVKSSQHSFVDLNANQVVLVFNFY